MIRCTGTQEFAHLFDRQVCCMYFIIYKIGVMATKKIPEPNSSDLDENYVVYNEACIKRKPMKRTGKGPWSIKQNSIYLEFLKNNKESFESSFDRRSCRIFRKLARALRRRNSQQCRSHHQKFENKYSHDINLIIQALDQKIESQKRIQAIQKESPMKFEPIEFLLEKPETQKDQKATEEDKNSELCIKQKKGYTIIQNAPKDLRIIIDTLALQEI